jgi:hypothetical protein
LEDHELAARKLAALVARSASRDVFDARELLQRPDLDRAKLRIAFVIYGGVNRVDWRTTTVDNIGTTARDVESQLVPMLRSDVRPSKRQVKAWADKLVRETRALMAAVLPLQRHELEFLERLNAQGEVAPDLLTDEPTMQAIIRKHPGIWWKAQNVRKHFGLPAKKRDDPPSDDGEDSTEWTKPPRSGRCQNRS